MRLVRKEVFKSYFIATRSELNRAGFHVYSYNTKNTSKVYAIVTIFNIRFIFYLILRQKKDSNLLFNLLFIYFFFL